MSKPNYARIIADMFNADMSRDTIIITLVSEHGATLNAATKAWTDFARENGIGGGPKTSYKDEAVEYMAEQDYQPTTDNLKSMQDELCDEFGIKPDTATSYIKAYCQRNGFTYPQLDPRKQMFDWLVRNARRAATHKDAVKKEFKQWAKEELGRSESNINEYWKGMELHIAIVAAQADEDASEQAEQEQYESTQTDEVKAAWATYHEVKAKQPNWTKHDRSKVHPDKVSHLNDDKLTAAYTELFKQVDAATKRRRA